MACDQIIPRSSDSQLMETVEATNFEAVLELVSSGENFTYLRPHGETPGSNH